MGIAAGLIREARKTAGLTMAELAERAGTSKPTVSRYENGLVDPGVETLSRLLHACGHELRARPVGLPSSSAEVRDRFSGRGQPTDDDVTRTTNGRELRTIADLEAFAAKLRGEGLLATRASRTTPMASSTKRVSSGHSMIMVWTTSWLAGALRFCGEPTHFNGGAAPEHLVKGG